MQKIEIFKKNIVSVPHFLPLPATIYAKPLNIDIL
jgi:hypothetical protein